MNKRRQFLIDSSILAAGTLFIPSALSAKKSIFSAGPELAKGVGVQVYSVRDALGKDFNGSMKKLADIGYTFIEGYGMGTDGKILGKPAKEYKKIVDDLGMKMVSSHCAFVSTPELAAKLKDTAVAAGVSFATIPSLPGEWQNDYYKVADNLNKVGEMFKGTGIRLGYHNHSFEFKKTKDGEVPLEILLNNTDKDLVTFQADLYWVTVGEYDPIKLIEKFPGRISSFHVKDANANKEQATIGTGTIDFEAIFNAGKKAGLEYYYIEDEREDDPFGNLTANFAYMNAAKFIK